MSRCARRGWQTYRSMVKAPTVTRRAWLTRFAAPALLGAGAAACAACGEPVSVPAQPQPTPARRMSAYVVRLFTRAAAEDLQWRQALGAIAEDFGRAHDDMHLEIEHYEPRGTDGTTVAGYAAALSAGVAAGTVADLAHFTSSTWQVFAGRGSLQPLGDFAARDRWTVPWPEGEAYELQTRFRGKRYLSPSSAGPMLMFYVQEHFQRAGVPYPRADWTYADFQDTARRLTRRADGRDAYGVYGYEWNPGYVRNAVWWRMNGTTEWDRIAEPRKAAWATPAVIEAFQYQLYDSQYKLGVAPPRSLLEAGSGATGIDGGGTAMKVEGPWFLQRMAERWRRHGTGPAGFDVQLLPTGKAGRKQHLNVLEGQVMTRNSKDRDAAWEVLKWIASEPGQRRIAESGRLCNVPDAVRALWLPLAKHRYGIANGDAFAKAMEGSTFTLVGELDEDLLDREAGLSQAIEGIASGSVSAKEAMTRVQPRVQQTLDRYWAAQQNAR